MMDLRLYGDNVSGSHDETPGKSSFRMVCRVLTMSLPARLERLTKDRAMFPRLAGYRLRKNHSDGLERGFLQIVETSAGRVKT